MKLFNWIAQLLIARVTRRRPDFVIGDRQNPYLRRWWVIPRNAFFNVYLHQILRSDPDRALHCHPWCNASLILSGAYIERVPKNQAQMPGWDYVEGYTREAVRQAGDITLRLGHWRHRLIVPIGGHAWTLFITGPVYRRWGFFCRTGWVYWRHYLDPQHKGLVGSGCGDSHER